MNPVTAIALCSLLMSVVTTVIMLFGQRHTVKTTYVVQLEKRIETLEDELTAANARIKTLEDHNGNLIQENIALLRQIAKIGA